MLQNIIIFILAINVSLLSCQVIPTTEPTTTLPPPSIPSTSTTERISTTTRMPSFTPVATVGLPVNSRFTIPATPPPTKSTTTTKRITTTTIKPLGVPVTSIFTLPPTQRATTTTMTTTPTPTPKSPIVTTTSRIRTTTIITTTTSTPHLTVGLPVTSRITITPTSTTTSTVLTTKTASKVPTPSSIPSKGNGSNTEKVLVFKPVVPGLPVKATIPSIPETEFNISETNAVGPPVFQNQTIVAPFKNETISVEGFCGYPPYSNRQACITQNYYKDNLSKCEVEGGVIVFSCAVVLLGIFIISANVLLPLVVWRNPDMRTQYDYIKVSLAFADMLMGILLITSVLPNVFRTRNLPLEQAVQYVDADTNSASAILTGSIQIVSTQASVLHLMFLSIERFTAIKWPLWHMRRRTSTITITLAALWAISLLSSFIPAAFPKYFEYKLQPALLIHLMTLKEVQQSGYVGPLYALFTLILPYVIMVVFCILTGIVVYQKFTSGVRKWQDRESTTVTNTPNGHKSTGTLKPKQKPKTKLKPEIFVFITIIIMIFAFTITLLPFGIVMTLFVVGKLSCSNYTLPYVISYYGGLSNSLANAFIYTVRDPKFRLAVRTMFCPKKVKSKYPSKTTSNSRSNQSTQM